MRKFRVALLLLPMVLVLSACFNGDPEFTEAEQVPADQRAAAEGEGDGEDAPATPRFVAVDIAFEEAPSEVAAGSVAFEFVNNGAAQHNVVIEELGSDPIVEAQGGGSDSATVDLEPGDYYYFCSIPGHEQGMNGTLTVTE